MVTALLHSRSSEDQTAELPDLLGVPGADGIAAFDVSRGALDGVDGVLEHAFVSSGSALTRFRGLLISGVHARGDG